MSREYYVHVVPAATAGTANHAILQIWNPSSTRAIQLLEIGVCFRAGAPAASAGFHMRRSTARGTTASTITPTAEHHGRRESAPDSAFVIDLAVFSAQPTLATGDLPPAWGFPAVAGSGVVLPIPRGIEIPPGTGLCACNIAGIITATADWSLVVEEL